MSPGGKADGAARLTASRLSGAGRLTGPFRSRTGAPGRPVGPLRRRTGAPPGPPPGRRPASRAPGARRAPSWRPRRRPGRGPPPARRPAGSGPGPGRRRVVEGAGRRRRRSWPTSVGVGSVRDRVIVVKSAKRTLMLTRCGRPARPPASRAAVRSASRSSSRRITAWSSTSVSKVSSAPMRLVRLVRAPPAAGPGPRPARAGARPAASPSARCRRGSGVAARSPTVSQAEPGQLLRGALADAPQRRRPAAGAGSRARRSAGTTSSPSGLHRAEASLATNLRRRHPDRAGDALLVGDPGADQLADPAGPAEPAPGAADVEERLVQRQRLHQRRDRPEDRHHARRTPRGSGEVGRQRPPPAGRAGGPAHRHRAAHAELPGLVGRREHHAARAAPPTITGWPRSSGRPRSSTQA